MGNRPITIGLETDQSDYAAGNTLQGKVYLSVNSGGNQTFVPAQSVQLRLIGKETAAIHRHESSNDSQGDHRSENRYERWTHTFFQLQYPLYTFPNQRATTGQYEYPFSITLPTDLPSSLRARSGESHCEVEYELTATIVQPGTGNNLFRSKNPQGSKKLNISACAQGLEDTSVHHPMDIIPVSCCCCCTKEGSMALETALDKTVAAPYDTIGVKFRCKNNSSSDVQTIRIQMEQVIEWNCNMHKKEIKQLLDKQEFSAASYPELMASLPKSASFFCCLSGSKNYQNVQDNTPLYQEWHNAQIKVPGFSQDSYQGQAIHVRHVVSVILVSDGCCNSNPESATMVQLVRSFGEQSNKDNSADGKDHHSAASPQPSAPLAKMDYYEESTAPAAVAHALPPDWHAQTAEVVDIPMAQAIVVEPSAPPME